MPTPLEQQVEARVQTRASELGGDAIKQNPAWRVGIPDRLVILPGGVSFFVECKRFGPGSELSDPQIMWRKRLMEMGFHVFVPDTIVEVD